MCSTWRFSIVSKPSIQDLHVNLERHIGISNMKFSELMNRVKRIEHIMIATSGTAIIMLIGLLVK